jgi:hypothetical protein
MRNELKEIIEACREAQEMKKAGGISGRSRSVA